MNKKVLKILLIIFTFIASINVYAEDDFYTNNYEDSIDTIESENTTVSDDLESHYVFDTLENGNAILIEDDANLLSYSEIDKLSSDMKSLTNYGNIAFKTISSNSYYSTENYARNFYHEKFGTSSGTLFLIDMDYRMIYIFSDGENYRYITKSKAQIITDNIYTYASNEEYYKCAKTAFSQMETILSGGRILEPMRYISNGVISLVLSFFIFYFIVLAHSKVKRASNAEILKNCDIDFNVGKISVRKTGQDVRYSPVDSSSGGSSGSSGGGGGGGSSGGGGGHSF